MAPGAGLTTGGDAHFFVTNCGSVGAAIKPIAGCVPQPESTGLAGQRPRLTVWVRELRLRPSSRAAYVHRCQAGERLVDRVPGVLFHTRRPPSARGIRQVTVASRVAGGRVRVAVRTGPDVGDNERVTLQILAICRR